MNLVTLALAAEARFWVKVDKGEGDGCWIWTAGLVEGYGNFWLGKRGEGGRMWRAHRIAWILATGTDPGDEFASVRQPTMYSLRTLVPRRR